MDENDEDEKMMKMMKKVIKVFFCSQAIGSVTWSCWFIIQRWENENLYKTLELRRPILQVKQVRRPGTILVEHELGEAAGPAHPGQVPGDTVSIIQNCTGPFNWGEARFAGEKVGLSRRTRTNG